MNYIASELGSLSGFPSTSGDGKSFGFLICSVCVGAGFGLDIVVWIGGTWCHSPAIIYQISLQIPPAFCQRPEGSQYQSIRVGNCGAANITLP